LASKELFGFVAFFLKHNIWLCCRQFSA